MCVDRVGDRVLILTRLRVEQSCTWPDHPRQRASEYFPNLPRDADGLHSESCPSASACVVTAIKKDFEVLSSTSASQVQKVDDFRPGELVGVASAHGES
jgi:hypothetical protein